MRLRKSRSHVLRHPWQLLETASYLITGSWWFVRHSAKWITHSISANPLNSSRRAAIVTPLHRWGIRGLGWLNNLPRPCRVSSRTHGCPAPSTGLCSPGREACKRSVCPSQLPCPHSWPCPLSHPYLITHEVSIVNILCVPPNSIPLLLLIIDANINWAFATVLGSLNRSSHAVVTTGLWGWYYWSLHLPAKLPNSQVKNKYLGVVLISKSVEIDKCW